MVRMVLVENCLSMSDEYFIGDGVQPDDLYEYIGNAMPCCSLQASSRVPPKSSRNEQKPPKKYGSRGAFLQELTTLSAAVEIESRVQEHWTSYRKVFKEGRVVFNARSKQLREAPGTKIAVANLFEKLPVRRKDLSRNRKYRSRVIQNVHNFCVSMSMIWPSLRSTGGDSCSQVVPRAIPGALWPTTWKRLTGTATIAPLSTEKDLTLSLYAVRGLLVESISVLGSWIPRVYPWCIGRMGQGIKQAKSYYQFAFLENEWVEECHRICSRVITEAALQILSGMLLWHENFTNISSLTFRICFPATPIFVLKIAAPSDHYDVSPVGQKGEVLFKNPEQLHQFLFEFVESLAAAEFNRTQVGNRYCVRYRHFVTCSCCKTDPPTSNYIGIQPLSRSCMIRYLVTASQGWRNEEIPLSSQRYNYIQVDDSDCGFIAEDDEQLSRESESHSGWSSAFGEHNVLVEQQQSESHLVGNLIRCRACGHFSDIRVDSGATGSLVSEPSDSQSADVAVKVLLKKMTMWAELNVVWKMYFSPRGRIDW
ncbi:Ribosomal protein S5 domain 2-type fold, subgroup [Phytophthora cactorum]|nr:Ribosomal protein S5 domain 2-type fold, subgroup [Phytophthora cactorum]